MKIFFRAVNVQLKLHRLALPPYLYTFTCDNIAQVFGEWGRIQKNITIFQMMAFPLRGDDFHFTARQFT